jgi:hypothetical protein
MKKQPIIITTVLLAGLLGFSQTARAVGFKDRLSQQEQRIQRGIASGQITPREAEKLYRDQYQVRQLRRHFLADGDLSRRERNTLKERMDRSNQRIYRYKHNRQRVQPPRYHDRAWRHFARHY